MMIKKELREYWKETADYWDKYVERRREAAKKLNALLELVPNDVAPYIDKYASQTHLVFNGKDISFFRKRLREAFGSWNDEVVHITPEEHNVIVVYRSTDDNVPVHLYITMPRETFDNSNILSENCEIREIERKEYKVVCNAR